MSVLKTPPWIVMWLIAGVLFGAAKWLSLRAAGQVTNRNRYLAYWFAWPGMDAGAFLRKAIYDGKPSVREWLVAGGNVALGVTLFWRVAPLAPDALVRGWLGMMAVLFLLHFGLFQLLSCFWRTRGVEARPIMQAPKVAKSVSEFWGRRWNTAVRDLIHKFLFRPLSPVLGPRRALALGFLVSGLVHDLVISVPAGAGYGLPTAYFCLQGAALLTERSKAGRWLSAGGWLGRTWTFLIVVLPAFVLFHPPFIKNVILPMMDALGASGGD